MLPRLFHRVEQKLFVTLGAAHWFAPLRYAYALLRDLLRGELTLRAMSLVYTTLLSIVPLLALSFSVLKGLGYHRTLEPVIYSFLEPIGEKAGQLTQQTMEFIDKVRGGVLGSLGLVFLLYTSVSMIQKIEEAFNFVWRVKEPRSLGRRVSEYISVLLIGPGLIIAALGLLATVRDQSVVRWIASIAPFGTILLVLSKATPYIIVVGVFTFLYAFVPNTKVRLRAAFIGGITAGLLWTAGGALFASFFGGSSGTLLIYAGFAIVILALIWLYLSWLILLIGVQLAFYVQHPQCLRPDASNPHLTPSLAERLGLSVMYLLAREFAKPGDATRERYTLNALAEKLYLAGTTLEPVVTRLLQTNILAISEDESLMPGRDLDAITLADIFDAVRNSPDTLAPAHSIGPADELVRHTEHQIRAGLQKTTLKGWIATADAPAIMTRDA